MTVILQSIWRLLLIATRVVLFLFLFIIATSNFQTVELQWFPGQVFSISVAFLCLGFFLLGILLSGLSFYKTSRRAKINAD